MISQLLYPRSEKSPSKIKLHNAREIPISYDNEGFCDNRTIPNRVPSCHFPDLERGLYLITQRARHASIDAHILFTSPIVMFYT